MDFLKATWIKGHLDDPVNASYIENEIFSLRESAILYNLAAVAAAAKYLSVITVWARQLAALI